MDNIIFFESYESLYQDQYEEFPNSKTFINNLYKKLDRDPLVIEYEKLQETIEQDHIVIQVFVIYRHISKIETFRYLKNGNN